jgi:plasmid stabilization system protein ParE
MDYKIIWSEEAKTNLSHILIFLQDNWDKKVISKFLAKLEVKMKLIQQSPLIAPPSEINKSIRKAVLTKHNSIVYKVAGNKITVLAFWDNRMNPSKLTKKIKRK